MLILKEKNVPEETKNSNRFGLECAFILGDLPMSARFFSIKFTYIQLDFDQLTSDFWFSGNFFGPTAYC